MSSSSDNSDVEPSQAAGAVVGAGAGAGVVYSGGCGASGGACAVGGCYAFSEIWLKKSKRNRSTKVNHAIGDNSEFFKNLPGAKKSSIQLRAALQSTLTQNDSEHNSNLNDSEQQNPNSIDSEDNPNSNESEHIPKKAKKSKKSRKKHKKHKSSKKHKD